MSLLSSLKRSSKCGWTTRDGASTLSKSGSYHKQTQRNANFDKTRSGKLRFWRMYCREYLPSYISPEWFQKRITISKTLFGGDSLYNPAWRSCVSWVRMEKSDPNIFGPKWWWKNGDLPWYKVYPPENQRLEPEKSPNWKGKSSSKPYIFRFHVSFSGV